MAAFRSPFMAGLSNMTALPAQDEDSQPLNVIEEVEVNEASGEEAEDQMVKIEETPTANATSTSLVKKLASRM